MPETYHVKLSDGREFNVTTDGGAPSESDVLAGLGHNSNASPVSLNEPDTFAGGVWKSVKQQFGDAAGPSPAGDEMPFAHASSDATQQMMNTPIVHPTGTRLDGLLSPAGVAGGALGVAGMVRPGTAARTAATALQEVPSLRKWVPGANMLTGKLRMIGQAAQDASMGVTRGADMYAMPKTESTLDRAPRAAQVIGDAPAPQAESAAAPSSGGMTAAERAALVRQGYSPELIAKIEAQTQPVASHEPTQPEQHPLRQPRVEVGAEVVGRQNGLTKEAVRQQTGPILGEQPGEASPAFPEKPFNRMFDKMLGMPKEGAERGDYVNAASDPKTMGQLEAIRRTLARLGYSIVPATALRGQLRLAPSHAPTTTNQGAVGSEIQQ